jgi:hypothetical protein
VSGADLSESLQRFVDRYVKTVDHVALLLALRDQAGTAQTPTALAASTRLDRDVVNRALADLSDFHLVRREVVEELAHMYRTMPVTLIRAIYARPARAATSFADAFRLRKDVE